MGLPSAVRKNSLRQTERRTWVPQRLRDNARTGPSSSDSQPFARHIVCIILRAASPAPCLPPSVNEEVRQLCNAFSLLFFLIPESPFSPAPSHWLTWMEQAILKLLFSEQVCCGQSFSSCLKWGAGETVAEEVTEGQDRSGLPYCSWTNPYHCRCRVLSYLSFSFSDCWHFLVFDSIWNLKNFGGRHAPRKQHSTVV